MKTQQSYTVMQFIDKRTGKLHNYIPDSSPWSYSDVVNVQAVFRVTRKYKKKSYSFKLFGKGYELSFIKEW